VTYTIHTPYIHHTYTIHTPYIMTYTPARQSPTPGAAHHALQGFWRSWHASYNRWLVRYVYVPLGGNR